MLDSIDKTILIGIIIIAMIVETSPLEEFEIALWIGITVRAVLGVNPSWRNDCDSSSEVKRRFGKDVPRTNLNIIFVIFRWHFVRDSPIADLIFNNEITCFG